MAEWPLIDLLNPIKCFLLRQWEGQDGILWNTIRTSAALNQFIDSLFAEHKTSVAGL